MKREKFLWPITHAHHYGLMAAKAIQRRLKEKPAKGELENLRKKAGRFFEKDLAPHIRVEEKLLNQLAYHTSPNDPFVERARREHQELRGILNEGGAKSLELFAGKFIRHIYFEEDELLRQAEEQFTTAEKEWVETELRFNTHDWPKIPTFSSK